jgi:hypothetical protein
MTYNHSQEFTASADLLGSFKSFIPASAGMFQCSMQDGGTATIKVTAGTQYFLRFGKIIASGTGVTGTAFE